MRKLIRGITRLSGWALVVALAVVLSANCVSGSGMTAEQEACCVAMASACAGAHAQQQDCCSTATQRVDELAAAKRVTAPLLVALVGPPVTLPDSRHNFIFDHRTLFDWFVPKPPGVPTYLLVSTLLI